MKLLDPKVQWLLESFTGAIKRCPAGHARAEETKKPEQAEFKCFNCGFVGKIQFEKLRQRRPISLRCRYCGRKLS